MAPPVTAISSESAPEGAHGWVQGRGKFGLTSHGKFSVAQMGSVFSQRLRWAQSWLPEQLGLGL